MRVKLALPRRPGPALGPFVDGFTTNWANLEARRLYYIYISEGIFGAALARALSRIFPAIYFRIFPPAVLLRLIRRAAAAPLLFGLRLVNARGTLRECTSFIVRLLLLLLLGLMEFAPPGSPC